MNGFNYAIKNLTIENKFLKKDLFNSNFLQLALGSLKIGEEIGVQKDELSDHFIHFEFGIGKCSIGGNVFEVNAGYAMLVPQGINFNIINVSDEHHLKFYNISSPPSFIDSIEKKSRDV
jgi:mannose-6-phosphate isomerase-like protein (cupin superfamily)